jgi:hypothetical protein
VLDILSMRLFVWLLGHQGELLDSHLFFFDRYSDLADYHRSKGRSVKADRLTAVAEWHFDAAPDDDDPEAAAMAMPMPRPRIRTNAVSAGRLAPHRRTGRRSEPQSAWRGPDSQPWIAYDGHDLFYSFQLWLPPSGGRVEKSGRG